MSFLCYGRKFSPPKIVQGRWPCFKLTLVLAWKTENVSIEQIKRNQMSQINCKILATLYSGENQPINEKENTVLMQTELRFLLDNRPALDTKGGLRESISVSQSIACLFVVYMILGSANTNIACFVGCKMALFCDMTRTIIHYVHAVYCYHQRKYSNQSQGVCLRLNKHAIVMLANVCASSNF